jgi:hypothetical protein
MFGMMLGRQPAGSGRAPSDRSLVVKGSKATLPLTFYPGRMVEFQKWIDVVGSPFSVLRTPAKR